MWEDILEIQPDVPYQKDKKKRPNWNMKTVLRTGLLPNRLDSEPIGHE